MAVPKIVVLSGAGISAESGLKTFRESGGLWEGFDVNDVATPEGWAKDPEPVLNFYNDRRKSALKAKPNPGHLAIADLEKHFHVTVVTQNVDNLHERASSSHVVHLHGSLFKSRSTADPSLVYDIEGWALDLGDMCEKGSQLRPHIVWFGELVPELDRAIGEARTADIFIVVGTSLQVYPAAGLIEYVAPNVPKYIVDPSMPTIAPGKNLFLLEEKASTGMPKVRDEIIHKFAR